MWRVHGSTMIARLPGERQESCDLCETHAHASAHAHAHLQARAHAHTRTRAHECHCDIIMTVVPGSLALSVE
jgi:hypothetical protein